MENVLNKTIQGESRKPNGAQDERHVSVISQQTVKVRSKILLQLHSMRCSGRDMTANTGDVTQGGAESYRA